jgi:hypothetical protein
VGIVEGVVPANVTGVSETTAKVIRECAVFIPVEALEVLV